MKRIKMVLVSVLMCAGSVCAKGKMYKSVSLGWGYCETPSYMSADVNLGTYMSDKLTMGGGIAAEYSGANGFLSMPLFVNIQGFLVGKASTPFVEFRMGYDIMRLGLYLQPSVGYRFPIKVGKVIKAIKPAVSYSWVNGSHDVVQLKIGVEL